MPGGKPKKLTEKQKEAKFLKNRPEPVLKIKKKKNLAKKRAENLRARNRLR